MEVEHKETDNDNNAGRLASRVGVDSRAGRPDDVGDEHADTRPEKKGASAKTVDQEGCTQSGRKVEDLEEAVDEGLVKGIRDADGVEDEREVVGDDADTVPLRKDAREDSNQGALPVTRRATRADQPVDLACLSLRMDWTISEISRLTSGLFSVVGSWNLVRMAAASRSRSWATSQRGDSGSQ